MWCRPSPNEFEKVDVIKKPKLSQTEHQLQNKKASRDELEAREVARVQDLYKNSQ